MNTIDTWARRWRIPQQAVAELKELFVVQVPITMPEAGDPTTEAGAQQRIRLAAPEHNVSLWRNNSGAVETPNGGMVRYGLGNDSKQLNAVVKSSDLIGITPVIITAEHLGRTLGIFTSVEVKRPGWRWPDTPSKREEAQFKWLQHVRGKGGVGMFATCPQDVWPL